MKVSQTFARVFVSADIDGTERLIRARSWWWYWMAVWTVWWAGAVVRGVRAVR